MAVTKPYLSRQYIYAPLTGLNFNLNSATIARIAFMPNTTTQPADADWFNAIVVTSTNGTGGAPHALYKAAIGDSLAILVGPLRTGETGITTRDLPAGVYLMWVDVGGVTGSDERYVDWSGSVTIVTAKG